MSVRDALDGFLRAQDVLFLTKEDRERLLDGLMVVLAETQTDISATLEIAPNLWQVRAYLEPNACLNPSPYHSNIPAEFRIRRYGKYTPDGKPHTRTKVTTSETRAKALRTTLVNAGWTTVTITPMYQQRIPT